MGVEPQAKLISYSCEASCFILPIPTMKKLFLEIYSRYKLQILFILLFAFLHGVSDVWLTYIGKVILDNIAWAKNFMVVVYLGIWLFFLNLFNQVFGALVYYRSHILNNTIEKDYKEISLWKFQKLTFATVVDESVGELGAVISKWASTLGSLSESFLSKIFQDTLTIFLAVGLLFTIHYSIPLIILFFFIPCFSYISFYEVKKRMQYRKQLEKVENKTSGKLQEFFQNIRDIKIFQVDTILLKLLWERFTDILWLKQRLSYLGHMMNFKQVIFIHLTSFTLICITSYLIFYHGRPVGDYLLVFGLFMTIRNSLWQMVFLYREFEEGFVRIKNFSEFLTFDESKMIEDFKRQEFHSLELKNIGFSYDGKNEVLKNVHIFLNKWDKIGLIGKSGVGKTTLISVILWLIEEYEGDMILNGKSIKWIKKNIFSYVPQDVQIFNENVRFNLNLWDETIQDSDMENMLAKVWLEYLGERTKEGEWLLDVLVGNDGLKLSGGERQRIGIARAMLRKKDIYIFDEVTSNLDVATEKDVLKLIYEISEGKTSIIISHKKEILHHVGSVFELKWGNLIEVIPN